MLTEADISEVECTRVCHLTRTVKQYDIFTVVTLHMPVTHSLLITRLVTRLMHFIV